MLLKNAQYSIDCQIIYTDYMASTHLHKIRQFLKLRYASPKSILIDMSLTVLAAMLFIGGILKTQGLVIDKPSDAAESFSSYESQLVTIGSKQYKLYVADTPDRQIQGLSTITSMKPHEGMMFVFERPGPRSFWMKDMNFPLDFIFVSRNAVVDIHENIQPDSYPSGIVSRLDADTVIELNAGEVSENGVTVGDRIEIRDS